MIFQPQPNVLKRGILNFNRCSPKERGLEPWSLICTWTWLKMLHVILKFGKVKKITFSTYLEFQISNKYEIWRNRTLG